MELAKKGLDIITGSHKKHTTAFIGLTSVLFMAPLLNLAQLMYKYELEYQCQLGDLVIEF